MDWNLLAKYLDDRCTPAENDAVCRWAAADASNAAELELLRRAWRRAGELPPAPRIEALWERIAQSAGIDLPPEVASGIVAPITGLRLEPGPPVASGRRHSPFESGASPRPRRWVTALLATAAVAVVAVGIARRLPNDSRDAGASTTQVAVHEYHTARGQRATVILLDGTRVVLGADSRLRVSMPSRSGKREGEGERLAYLDGEALFDVVHIDSQPFLVHAAGAVARDLGTTFGVRAYADEPVRVVVVEGSVAVRDSAPGTGREAVLGARDMVRFAPGELDVARDIDPAPFIAWSEGALVFRQARLAEVATQLERTFDVRITVADPSLLDARVSATFDESEGIDAVLRALGETLDAAVRRDGQGVAIRARR